jgi:selenoprotein W-related protein
MKPAITIEYCPKCNWLLRAAYMAQEFLTTFADELYGVTLRPSETGGHYSIRVDDSIIFDRKAYGRFPEINELKQMLRDKVKPEKSLGHSDKK